MIFNYGKERRKIENSEWVRQSFMISHGVSIDGLPDDDDVKMRARFFTTAAFKFTDTTLGGNIVINPLPQFTRSADLRVKSMYAGSEGMGRAYSEYIDDNKRYITMNFGVPQFNSLSSYFQSFYDSQASSLARTGRSGGIAYTIGRIAGFVVSIRYLPLMLMSMASAGYKWALQKPTSKFYYLKPTMPLFWNATSAICNDLAVKTGMISLAFGDRHPSVLDNRDILSDSEAAEINRLLGPEMLDSFDPATGQANGINIYAIATRAQRQARRAYQSVRDHYGTMATGNYTDTPATEINKVRELMSKSVGEAKHPRVSFEGYIASWLGTGGEYGDTAKANAVEGGSTDFESNAFSESILKSKGKEVSWTEFRDAEFDDGAQYVSFRVENSGAVSESFSSQVGESELASKLNSMSGSARSMRNDMAQGNISDGLIGQAIGGLLQGAGNVLTGFADQVGLGGLAAFGGNAFADVPKNWQSSATRMPQMSYTIKLRSPYGNRYSRFVNLYVPLAMLLAAALPLSTGRHSYTSPFICSLFDRGRAQTRLGIIESLSITRGTTNLPFNKIGEPLGIDVTFNVIDLSNVMHMPISQGFGFTEALKAFDDETMYDDYMAVLGALSLHEQVYTAERFKLAMTKILKNSDSFWSVPHATNWLGDTIVGRVASLFYDGAVNR